MSEDTKSKFDDKFKALISEKELDKIAGGTMDENFDILNAMMGIDPYAVSSILEEAAKSKGNPQYVIDRGVEDLLDRYFGITASANTGTNDYASDYAAQELLSHDEVMAMIKKKVAERF